MIRPEIRGRRGVGKAGFGVDDDEVEEDPDDDDDEEEEEDDDDAGEVGMGEHM